MTSFGPKPLTVSLPPLPARSAGRFRGYQRYSLLNHFIENAEVELLFFRFNLDLTAFTVGLLEITPQYSGIVEQSLRCQSGEPG